MNKVKKYKVKKMFVGSVIVTSVAGAVVSTVALSIDQTTKQKINYDGSQFNSYEEVLNYLIKTDRFKISKEKVIGEIASSYADFSKGQLNKAFLPTYDPNKIDFAWLSGTGQILRDREAAIQTYYNSGLLSPKWTDGSGNIFSSKTEAEASRERNFVFPNLGFYDGVPMFGKNNSIVTSRANRFNPLNEIDVKTFEENIRENVFNIINNTIFNNVLEKGGYSAELDSSKITPQDFAALTAEKIIDLTTSSYEKVVEIVGGEKVKIEKDLIIGDQDVEYNLRWKSKDWLRGWIGNVGIDGDGSSIGDRPELWNKENGKILDFNWDIHKDSDPSKPIVNARAYIGANQQGNLPFSAESDGLFGGLSTGGLGDILAAVFTFGGSYGTSKPWKSGVFNWLPQTYEDKDIVNHVNSASIYDGKFWEVPSFGSISQDDLLKIINLTTEHKGYILKRADAPAEEGGPQEISYGFGRNLVYTEVNPILHVPTSYRLDHAALQNMFSDITGRVSGAFQTNRESIINSYLSAQSTPLFMKKTDYLLYKNFERLIQNDDRLDMVENTTKSRYEISDLPEVYDFEAKLENWLSSDRKFKIERVKTNSKIKGHVAFEVRKINASTLEGVNRRFETAKNLTNALWNWSDAAKKLPIIIKKDNHPIFALDLKADNDGQPIVDTQSWKNVSTSGEQKLNTNLWRVMSIFDNVNPFTGVVSVETEKLRAIREIILNSRSSSVTGNDKYLLSREHSPNYDAGYSIEEGLKQYFFFLEEVASKIRGSDQSSLGILRASIPTSSNKLLYLGPKADAYFHIGTYSMRNISRFNPSVSVNGNVTGELLGTSSSEVAELKRKEFVTSVASILVAYDFNGRPINHDSLFDDEYVIKANFLNGISPRRDEEHVFIKGIDDPFVNKISTIYKVQLNDSKYYYFDSHQNLYNYLIEYVERLVLDANS